MTSRSSIAPWCDTFEMPRFSRSTQRILLRNEITRSARVEIISCIAREIWRHTEYPTPAEYTHVCMKLIADHPGLKDTIGNGYVSANC